MKKYWKIIVPIVISTAALSMHFLPLGDIIEGPKDPGFIFDIRKVLGKKLTDKDIPNYSQYMGSFVKKSEAGHYPDVKGEVRAYSFKNGNIETIDGMIFAVWYLFKSKFAKINGFDPGKLPVPGALTTLKSFGFPATEDDFAIDERAFVWEEKFNIRQVQLYREPAGGNTIVSIQAYLIIPWEGISGFHQKLTEKHKDQEEKEKKQNKNEKKQNKNELIM